jgi:hypothetical protein
MNRLWWLLVAWVTAGWALLGLGQTLDVPAVGVVGCLVLGAAAVALSFLMGTLIEKARSQQPGRFPLRVGDLDVRGYVQIGVGVVVGVLAGGVFVCWLTTAWYRSERVEKSVGVGRGMTLGDASVEGIAREVKADGSTGVLTLNVSHRGRSIVCEFQPAKVPRTIQPGDTVWIRGTVGRRVPESGHVLLENCEVTEAQR